MYNLRVTPGDLVDALVDDIVGVVIEIDLGGIRTLKYIIYSVGQLYIGSCMNIYLKHRYLPPQKRARKGAEHLQKH